MQPSLMAILWKRGIRQSLDGGKVWVEPASRLTDDDRWANPFTETRTGGILRADVLSTIALEEIGKVMQRTPNAARMLWLRAVERLQLELEADR